MPDTPLHIAQLMRSASRGNAGVFVAASGLSRALAQHVGLELAVFAVRDEHTEADRGQWGKLPLHAFPLLGPAAFSFAPGLGRAVRDFKPHIVHQHGLWTYPSLVTQRMAKRHNASVIISVHGMLTPWALQHGAKKKKVALRLYEQNNLASADCIHALTPPEVDEIRALGIKTPICLVNNGVALEDNGSDSEPTGRERPEKGELLYVGRLHAIKGISELLQGWAIYKAKCEGAKKRQWRLKIVGWGDEPYRDKLLAMIAELDIGESVDLVGPQFGDDLLAAYKNADAFVLTSHSEAMPMAILEAWASGLPVIMTEECGLPEGYALGAAMKTSTHPQEIAKTLADMAQMSKDSRRKMGSAGRALVEERYSWQSVARSFAAVYEWLAGRGAKPDCVIT